jgi:L-alanine-DL-glutamate epimerase-like enolase superfamily enzyme
MHHIEHEVINLTRAQIRVLEPVKSVTPFQDATMGPFPNFGMAILTLEDDEGHIGEAPIYSSYSHILETCLLPILFHGHNVPYASKWRELYWSIRNEGFRGPAAALLGQVDMALHDLAARRSQMPLHEYLGGRRDSARVYGSGGGTNYTLKELEKEVSYFLEAGVDCYKMKVGSDFGSNMAEDAARVKFVRQLIGNDVRLAVDANQIWTNTEALRFLDR